jgi:hypothetical protein
MSVDEDKVIALRERVVGAMPWYDEAHPDYTELDAVLREALTPEPIVNRYSEGDLLCRRLSPKAQCQWLDGHYGGCVTR